MYEDNNANLNMGKVEHNKNEVGSKADGTKWKSQSLGSCHIQDKN